MAKSKAILLHKSNLSENMMQTCQPYLLQKPNMKRTKQVKH